VLVEHVNGDDIFGFRSSHDQAAFAAWVNEHLEVS
jgi:hypothetical protein